MSKESVLYKEIIRKLERKTKREFGVLALAGGIITILLTVSVFFIYALLESVFHFNSSTRSFLFFFFILVTLTSTAFLFILPLFKYYNLFRKTDYFRTAAEIGNYYPVIKDDLLNAMQLVSVDTKFYYSPLLVDAAFNKVYEKSQNIKFEESVSYKLVKELFYYGMGTAVVMVVLLLFVPGLQAASNRLYNFEKEFTPPAEFTLTVFPGDSKISKGENLLIRVVARGKIPNDLNLGIKSVEQSNYEMVRIISDSAGVFEHNVLSVRSSFNYYAVSGDIKSEEYQVEVTDRPLIKNFEVTVTPPAYSRLPEFAQKDNGNIYALMGSSVTLRLNTNKELNRAELEFSDSVRSPLELKYSAASGKFQVKEDKSYKIILTDLDGNNNDSPIEYTIKTQYDDYPLIEMIEPAKDINLANDNRIPLIAQIGDDFGFSKMVVKYRLSASKYEKPVEEFTSVEIPVSKNVTEAEIDYVWNLSSLSLATDDLVTYYLEIFDNDRVSGPKSTKTAMYNVRVPSLEELLASVDKKHSEVTDDLQQTLKEAEELKKNLEKINDDLKQDKKELTWQEKEKIENALDKFEELQEKLKESGESMDQLQQDLQKNNLLSKETMEKYMELQKLFDELSGEEFKKAMEQMREQLQKMDRKAAQDALENMSINEERFKKSLERTLNLLKRVKIEQKMDDLVKRAEDINKTLDELLKENQNSQNAQKQQENTSDQLEKMEKEMDKLEKDMEGLDDMPKEDLEKISDEFEKQKNDELSKEAEKNLQQNKMEMAKQNQSQLSKNMQNFSQQMKNLQQQMQQQNQMQTFADMMKMMEGLITLSKQQEDLKTDSQGMNDFSSPGNNAEKQSNLQKSLDNLLKQLGEMSQKTFAVTPEMGKALGDARKEMQKSLQALQIRNGTMAANSQGESMKSLNEAASLMQGSLESMMQGGGQGGMMSLMQQMGQMSQQQMSLNNLTQKLQQGNKGELTPSEMAELQRIQQQQDIIKKSLEELNREARRTGQSKKLPGNLDNIVNQMEEVISDMNTQRLDDNLIQKQERILSRLLDAQRSMNERDFEKQRESFSGENIARESPTELNLNSDKGRDRIKDELNRAVNEGYKKDYENLIRKYFEELQKENKK